MILVDGGVGSESAGFYIGSSNMDWLSLSQVKELGCVVRDPTLGRDAAALFERWWTWGGLGDGRTNNLTRVATDRRIGLNRTVPCWSALLPTAIRCPNPLNGADTAVATAELTSEASELPAGALISASPPEVVSYGADVLSDLDALVLTVRGATSTVSLSVMDIAPASMYRTPTSVVWWPDLFDALIAAATTRGVRVRLLISLWAHTSTRQLAYLKQLAGTGTITMHDAVLVFKSEEEGGVLDTIVCQTAHATPMVAAVTTNVPNTLSSVSVFCFCFRPGPSATSLQPRSATSLTTARSGPRRQPARGRWRSGCSSFRGGTRPLGPPLSSPGGAESTMPSTLLPTTGST